MSEWYANHANVIQVATYLTNEGILTTPEDVIYLFEKPWKYSKEFEEMELKIKRDGLA